MQSYYTSKLGPDSGNCTLLLFHPDEVSSKKHAPPTPRHNWLIESSMDIISLSFRLFCNPQPSIESIIILNSCKHAGIFQLLKPEGNQKCRGSLQMKAISNCMIEIIYGWGKWYTSLKSIKKKCPCSWNDSLNFSHTGIYVHITIYWYMCLLLKSWEFA